MPRPENITPQAYAALRARHAEAKQRREELERLAALTAQNPGRKPYNVPLADTLIAELETLIAAEQGGAAYNRSASDLEGVRRFLETELAAARAVLETPAPTPPAPLASADAKAVGGYVDSVLAYREASAARGAAMAPALARLSLAYAAAREAAQLIWHARKAAGLPAPATIVPQPPNELHPRAPISLEEIDRDLAAIEAQRGATDATGAQSEAERKLRELLRSKAEYEDELAAEAAIARIEALPPAQKRREIERLRIAAEG